MQEKIMLSVGLCVLLAGCSPLANKKSIEQVPLIPRMVFASPPEKTHVRISPDGTRLAYLAPDKGGLNVWIKTIGKNDDHVVTDKNVGHIDSFCWAYNNKDMLFTQDSGGNERWHIYKINLQTSKTVDLTPFENVSTTILAINKHYPDIVLITMNKENSKLQDAYRLDLASGKLELAAKNPGDIDTWLADDKLCIRAAVTAHPDGSSALLTRKDESSKWIQTVSWNFEDSLVGSVPPAGSRPINFSHDGGSLYLIDSTGANTQRLVRLDLATGQRETLASDNTYDIDSGNGRSSVIVNLETGKPALVSFMRERKEWEALDNAYKQDLPVILSLDKGDLTYICRSIDDKLWVLGFVHDNGPCAYYLYNRQTKKSEFLFYDKPILNNYTLAQTKPISFKARDGLTIHGYLTCPPIEQSKKLPLVLWVHGGPWWRDIWGYHKFNVWAQLFANRGYVCLQVNYRGSTGYGKQFLNAGDRECGNKMHNDLIDAVNWAINEGIADKTKIAIAGESFGGYAALIGATITPDVFCCAIDMWGPTNLVTLVQSIVDFRPTGKAKWYRRLGNPETDAEFLQSRSPLFYVDNIKIPILIAQGANDPRVKQSESEQIVAAMKAKGIEHEYLVFPGEGHGLVQPQNNIKLAIAIERLLAKHLGGRFEE